jgi:uncharacterized protein (DUF58 family)
MAPWRRSIIRPLGLLALALVCFLTAQGTGIRLFIHLSYLLLSLLVLSFVWSWLNLRGLRIERAASAQRAQVGDVVDERLLIENRWPFPRLWLEVQDCSDLPQHGGGLVTYLPAFARRRWVSRTTCTMRGKFTLGPATLSSGDPFGLFRLERVHGTTNELVVYPRAEALTSFVLPVAALPGGQASNGRTLEATASVAGVRDYVFGDGMNRIHWRSTARTGRLMVKEFELDPSAQAYVVLDMAREAYAPLDGDGPRSPHNAEEYAVGAAVSIARYLLDGRRDVGMIAWGQHHELLTPEREERQMLKVLEALAVLRAHGAHPLAEVLTAEGMRFGRSSSLVVITPSLDQAWVAALQQLLYRGVRATVLLLDGRSFGAEDGGEATQGLLGTIGVPVYMLRRGQSVSEALAAPAVA